MADAVLFVEGPSDEAAIRAWWKTLFDEVPEPHVTLFPLGGSNLKHISKQSVTALARPAFAILDSDRAQESDDISTAAKQFSESFKEAIDTHVWSRRALENYFAPRATAEVLRLKTAPEIGPFAKLSDTVRGYGKATHAGRIAAAMTSDEIPTEVRRVLERVRRAARP